MKKILFIALFCGVLVGHSQIPIKSIRVQDTTVEFITIMIPGDQVFVLDDSASFVIKNNVYYSGDNMHDVIDAGDAGDVGSGGGAATGWTLDNDTTSTTKLVGIGTTAPAYTLDINGISNSIQQYIYGQQFITSGSYPSNIGKLKFGGTADIEEYQFWIGNSADVNNQVFSANLSGTSISNTNSTRLQLLPKYIQLFTNDASNPRLTIDSNGSVGIGTDTPTEKFEVYDGNILADTVEANDVIIAPEILADKIGPGDYAGNFATLGADTNYAGIDTSALMRDFVIVADSGGAQEYLIHKDSVGSTAIWEQSNDTISTIAGVDVIDIRLDTLSGDGGLWFTDPHNADNVLIGDGAGSTNATHGNGNVGIGSDVLKAMGAGTNRNAIIGATAAVALLSANCNYNCIVGYGGLGVGNASSRNSGMGYSVMGSSYCNNVTAVGYKSGQIGNGDNGAYFGYYSGTYETGTGWLIIDNFDRTNEALSRTSALISGQGNATPASQTLQLGGGGDVSIAGELTTGNSFGEMYNPTTVISTASSSVWYALLGWTAGLTNDATADVVDSMMILNQAGTYKIDLALSFTHATVSTIIECAGFKRDGAGAWTELANLHFERKVGTGGDVGSASFSGLATLAAGDTLGVRVQSNNTGNFTVNHGNLNVIRIK